MAKILLIAGDLTQSDRMAAFRAARFRAAIWPSRRFVGIAPRSWCWTVSCRDLARPSAVPILMLSDIRNGQRKSRPWTRAPTTMW